VETHERTIVDARWVLEVSKADSVGDGVIVRCIRYVVRWSHSHGYEHLLDATWLELPYAQDGIFWDYASD
jgi:hypothetical protein